MIKSPYNFVPLSDKVVQPFWANQVSHDIPFREPQSGVLKLKITAKNPIYVRNGVPKSEQDTDGYNVFNNIENRYFIPGSSIKGMLRSVMEIMSYGRMKNKVNDHRYSVRDFQNPDIYDKTTLSNKVECGWLYKKGDEYYLDMCGKPGRISHKNLDVLCKGEKISDYYKKSTNVKDNFSKSAESKYEKFSFSKEGYKFEDDFESNGRKVYKVDFDGGRKGVIVMSGQPGVRNEPKSGRANGKHLEFVFFESNKNGIALDENVIENFLFAYYDHDINQQSFDWKWRKKQLNAGEKIPVFYQKNKDGSVKDLGLSLLYKITYKNSILDLINNTQKQADFYDLAETIFGYTEEKKALKGRIHVGHAFAEKDVTPLELKTEVLAGPKASYYPNYIEQKNLDSNGKIQGKYRTYMDNDAKIRGWKRYPIHSGDVEKNPAPLIKGKRNEKVATKFIPLPAETSFSFDIHYHNLRKEELGALISAITFHNTEGLYHSIGSAKPLGYGKISLEVENLEEAKKLDVLKAYELYMNSELSEEFSWHESEQIKELFAMAKPSEVDSKLSYMDLEDFVKSKGKGRNDPEYALRKYSEISGYEIGLQTLITEAELQTAKALYEREKKEFQKQQDIETIKTNLIKETRIRLRPSLADKKELLLNQLHQKQSEIRKKEALKQKERKAQKVKDHRDTNKQEAEEEGLNLEDFDSSDKKAFSKLGRQFIMQYARKLHKVNEKKLKKFADGKMLQEKDYPRG